MATSELLPTKSSSSSGKRNQVLEEPSAVEDAALQAAQPQHQQETQLARQRESAHRGSTSGRCFDNYLADNISLNKDIIDRRPPSESNRLPVFSQDEISKDEMGSRIACSDQEHTALKLRGAPLANTRDFEVDDYKATSVAQEGRLLSDSMSRMPRSLLNNVHNMVGMKGNLTTTSTPINDLSTIDERFVATKADPPLPTSTPSAKEFLQSAFQDTSRHSLLLWVYEIDNRNLSFAERLEKSNWEAKALEKL